MARKEVLLWSSAEQRDANGIIAARADAGGFTDAVERHVGENNGGAQARLCPATGKLGKQHGDLRWMNDVRAFNGSGWSGDASDPVIGSSTGAIMPFDYINSGPYTRLEHLHVIDCAGFNYCKIYWQARCLAYEGLAIDAAQVVTDKTTFLVNIGMADSMRIAAAGMPVVDSSDPMFSLPKMFRMNVNDALATEFGAGASVAATSTYSCVNATDILTLTGSTAGVGLYNNDVVTVTATANGFTASTKYFVVNANAAHTSFQLSLSSGGAVVPASADGTGTINLPYNGPGGGRPRGIPMQWGTLETGINWTPDYWISGGEPLYVQYKPAVYGTTTDWRGFEIVTPALAFETSTFTTQYQNANGPPAMMQQGKVFKTADDKMVANRFTIAGDKFESSCWIGYPNRTSLSVAAQTDSNTAFNNISGQPLSIAGLSRIALTIGALGLGWYGDTPAPVTWDQATRNTSGYSSFLKTAAPGNGKLAPRQHLRGRLWAVLFN